MNVLVTLVTKTQGFPVDTVDTDFTYTLTSTDAGGVNVSETDAGTSHTFSNVAAGEYTVVVSKLGFSANASVSVKAGPNFEVPDTVTVTVQ